MIFFCFGCADDNQSSLPIDQRESSLIQPEGGTYTYPPVINMSSSIENATIRYTNDGTNPDRENGIIYAGEFSVLYDSQIKAIAYNNDTISEISTAEFIVRLPENQPISPEFSPLSGVYDGDGPVKIGFNESSTTKEDEYFTIVCIFSPDSDEFHSKNGECYFLTGNPRWITLLNDAIIKGQNLPWELWESYPGSRTPEDFDHDFNNPYSVTMNYKVRMRDIELSSIIGSWEYCDRWSLCCLDCVRYTFNSDFSFEYHFRAFTGSFDDPSWIEINRGSFSLENDMIELQTNEFCGSENCVPKSETNYRKIYVDDNYLNIGSITGTEFPRLEE